MNRGGYVGDGVADIRPSTNMMLSLSSAVPTDAVRANLVARHAAVDGSDERRRCCCCCCTHWRRLLRKPPETTLSTLSCLTGKKLIPDRPRTGNSELQRCRCHWDSERTVYQCSRWCWCWRHTPVTVRTAVGKGPEPNRNGTDDV